MTRFLRNHETIVCTGSEDASRQLFALVLETTPTYGQSDLVGIRANADGTDAIYG